MHLPMWRIDRKEKTDGRYCKKYVFFGDVFAAITFLSTEDKIKDSELEKLNVNDKNLLWQKCLKLRNQTLD